MSDPECLAFDFRLRTGYIHEICCRSYNLEKQESQPAYPAVQALDIVCEFSLCGHCVL